MPVECLSPAVQDRAIEVQLLLADRGQHRAPSIPDLVVAALADKSGLTVLALNRDFDLIAQITGQPLDGSASVKRLLQRRSKGFSEIGAQKDH